MQTRVAVSRMASALGHATGEGNVGAVWNLLFAPCLTGNLVCRLELRRTKSRTSSSSILLEPYPRSFMTGRQSGSLPPSPCEELAREAPFVCPVQAARAREAAHALRYTSPACGVHDACSLLCGVWVHHAPCCCRLGALAERIWREIAPCTQVSRRDIRRGSWAVP